MTNLNQPLEATGPTVEEAIATGLIQLSLPREAVEIEIIDEGSKGLFGLGSREAIVRLTPLQETAFSSTPTLSQSESQELLQDDSTSDESEETDQVQDQKIDEDAALMVARETVTELIQKMHIQAEVTAAYQEQEDERRNRPNIMVEINGDDLSILIGRQAETLNALQYITRLIVGKELNRGVDLEVDVQGYRTRRNDSLRRLARQMADQATRTGKRQYLEPMASDDRRIIHIELRNHPQVFTESMGDGSRRKVTIVPK
jgi:spoIIIJ-associated protein